jgi:hypothetical protein
LKVSVQTKEAGAQACTHNLSIHIQTFRMAHSTKTLTETDLKELDLSTLTHGERVRALRTMLDIYEPTYQWAQKPPVLSAFLERLYATLPSEQDIQPLWLAARAMTDRSIAEFERWMAYHETRRQEAAADAEDMPSKSDAKIEEYLYTRVAHCEDCARIAMSKVPEERLQPIWYIVKAMHMDEKEDEMEARASKW